VLEHLFPDIQLQNVLLDFGFTRVGLSRPIWSYVTPERLLVGLRVELAAQHLEQVVEAHVRAGAPSPEGCLRRERARWPSGRADCLNTVHTQKFSRSVLGHLPRDDEQSERFVPVLELCAAGAAGREPVGVQAPLLWLLLESRLKLGKLLFRALLECVYCRDEPDGERCRRASLHALEEVLRQ